MKRIITLLIAAIMITGLCACNIKVDMSQQPKQTPVPETEKVMSREEISELFNIEHIAYGGSQLSYYRDVVTDVLFLRYEDASGYAGQGGLTWIPDPETGLPMTYTRYVELATGKTNSQDTTSSAETKPLS